MQPPPVPLLQLQQMVDSDSNSSKPKVPSLVVQPQHLKTTEQVSAFKVSCPCPHSPPLHPFALPQSKTLPSEKNNEVAQGSLMFSALPLVSATNSYVFFRLRIVCSD